MKLFGKVDSDENFEWLDEFCDDSNSIEKIIDNAELCSKITVSTYETGGSEKSDRTALLRQFNKHSLSILAAQFRKRKTDDKESKSPKKVKDDEILPDEKYFNQDVEMADSRLKLKNEDLFFCGPAILSAGEKQNFTRQDIQEVVRDFTSMTSSYKLERDFTKVVDFSASQKVLKHHATHMKLEAQHDDVNNLISQKLRDRLNETHQATQEILRIFWSCFPVTTRG